MVPIRQVRIATNMSQRKFADFVRIKFDLYQSLELARARWTPANAANVEAACGAHGHYLNHETSKQALTVLGDVYTAESFEWWRNRAGMETERDAETCAERLSGWLRVMLQAGQAKGRLMDVAVEVGKVLSEVRRDFKLAGFNLEKETNAVLSKIKIPVVRRYTVKQLRENKDLAKRAGYRHKEYRDGKLVEDSEVLTFKSEFSPAWHPAYELPKSSRAS